MDDKIKIVFLAANPVDAGFRPRLDEEAREIEKKIQAGTNRDRFELITQWAVRPGDLQEALLRHRPQIVHFSGHGNEDQGIILEDESGRMRAVSREALADLFDIFKKRVRVVVLNACYSKTQIEAFRQVIDYTIGMNTQIGDRAAIVFASSFYRALAFGEAVREAFRLAVNQLRIDGIAESDTPELFIRDENIASESLVNVAQGEADPAQHDQKDRLAKQINIVNGNKNTFIA
jgi:hypothetical protein